MSMLSDAFSYMAGEMNDAAGETATLVRGASTFDLTVVPQGQGNINVAQLAGTVESSVFIMDPPEQSYCGFLVKVSDYQVDGSTVLPERGDKLVIGDLEFWLAAPANQELWHYHPNSLNKTWYFINTKINDPG